jgi:hypothetical protein
MNMSDYDQEQEPDQAEQNILQLFWAYCQTCSWKGDDHANDRPAAEGDKKEHKDANPSHDVRIGSVSGP